ncbi:MAG: MarR family winged helix-turn-helix transcriptional regulator [Pseudomonadota bacterium]
MSEAETKQTESPPLRLDDFLPYRLSILSNAISTKIADIYETEFSLTIWQWRIIAVLGEHAGLTATDVAQRTLMDKPTVSRAVTILLERGLVERITDKEDRRRMPLALTDAGQRIYKAVIPRALECEDDMLNALDPREIAVLHALLMRLSKAVAPDGLWKDTGA